MSESIRSFISFDIEDDEVLNKISGAQRKVIDTGADLKMIKPQNIHVTMRFLGNINRSMVDKVFAKMKDVNFTPFKFKIQGLGAFPNLGYLRVIWAGITEGGDQMQDIFNQLEPDLQKLGFNPDRKGFSPHLTIARVKSGRNKTQLAEYVKEHENYEFGKVEANCLRLKKSTLTPKGPIYTTLREYCPPQKP